MEWEAPALVLSASPYGESSAIVHLLTEDLGLVHGLARGGTARANRALWQPGNLIRASWRGRLPDQLGNLSGELVHGSAARLMSAPLALAMLASACAVADGTLPEREPHPRIFHLLTRFFSLLSLDPDMAGWGGMAALLRWEACLLGDLGYGMDLSACAVTGRSAELAWVSPRTGRAVSDAAAGEWRPRLLRLPPLFLDESDPGTVQDWRDGLRLTGHFLARDAFGQRHRPLPPARLRLVDMIDALQPGALHPDD
ncbi:DNA repair protein RecO [Gluconacetobacter diazotrophicus]|uniref:DNA repair protein RecO n=1 Tax=Gluconacetobacter diazotrophicus TaxID=33996 RepID=A0A7W4FDS2_GLUDI|nr:DNA repair protein RecO [Gluconacetobacter diazotrophicus]MBB2155918.1 DNA repair protein RecO [Gluconacetobacter diazotrophicus]